jgi:CDP-diacylglycerol---glycerol-3-phosphate 3-phosphatidyltransferase
VQFLSSPALTVGPLLAFTAIFLLGLGAFAVRSALYGRPRTARVQRQGGSILLGEYLMEYGLWMFRPVERAAVRLEVHPDVFSWASLALHLAAALLLALGAFGLGAWVLIFGAGCDALDGAVARARGLASDAGEVLDAAVDRWAEMAVFLGYAWYYRGLWWGFLLACSACAGAVMVSYARAKGEIYGIDARMGLMQRQERAAWLAVATVFSALWELWRPSAGPALHPPVLLALGAIAVLANWTAWKRTAFVRRELRRR